MNPAPRRTGHALFPGIRQTPRSSRLPKATALALAVALGSQAGTGIAGELTDEALQALDWQPLELIPTDEIDLQCRQCRGRFVDPLADVDRSQAPEDADLEVSARRTEIDNADLIFEGDVSITQGYRKLRADRVVVDRAAETVDATGTIELREPGVLLVSERAFYDNNTEVAELTDARFVLHDEQLNGSAGSLSRKPSGVIDIRDGAITYCAPADPTWELITNKLEIDPASGVGTARDAKLEFAGVPVFYTPWIQFPLDDRRKTGLLFPDIGSDTRGGVDITAPMYVNLAPNYDATYSPRYIGERGLLHQLQGRYLDKTIDYWEVNGAYLGRDEKYAGEFEGADPERWLIGVQHQGNHGDGWRTLVDYGKVSDPDYIRDFENDALTTQRQTALLQLGQVDWLGDDIAVNVQVQDFQSLADDIRPDYKKLPQITARWRGDANWRGVEPIGELQYSNFDSDAERVTGQRVYGEAGATYPMLWEFGFLRPTVKYRALAYELENPLVEDDATPSAGSALASIDGGLIFERRTSLGGEGMLQTLEPRIYYLYSQFDEQAGQPDFDSAELTFSYDQLYRETRFSGNDRLDDADQMSVGVTTRLYADSDGRERLTASIGQIFYFRDREVRLNAVDPVLNQGGSAIAAEFNWLASDAWAVRSSVLYDPYADIFDAASVQLGWTPGNGTVFNLGYARREPLPSLVERPITEQANISGYLPIDRHWSVFGALEYSIEADASVEDMVGVEYDDCCWRVRMLYMRFVDTAPGQVPDFSDPDLERERAFQFQVVLKGMGGFGGRVDNLMKDMIRGFNDRY